MTLSYDLTPSTTEHLSIGPRVGMEWIGGGAWRAIDCTVAPDDAGHVVAYVECAHHHVEVVWTRQRGASTTYDTLRDAYLAIVWSLA